MSTWTRLSLDGLPFHVEGSHGQTHQYHADVLLWSLPPPCFLSTTAGLEGRLRGMDVKHQIADPRAKEGLCRLENCEATLWLPNTLVGSNQREYQVVWKYRHWECLKTCAQFLFCIYFLKVCFGEKNSIMWCHCSYPLGLLLMIFSHVSYLVGIQLCVLCNPRWPTLLQTFIQREWVANGD